MRGIIPVTKIIKEAERILVLLPFPPYNSFSLLPALQDLRKHFRAVEMVGVMKKDDLFFFQRREFFDKHIVYEGDIKFLSRIYFDLLKKFRVLKADISIDFNEKNPILSKISQAKLRVGTINTKSINCRIKIPGILNETERASEIVKPIINMCNVRIY